MPGRLFGKVAIITGAANELGRQTALTFHREGATVVCSDIRDAPTNPKDSSTQDLITQDRGKAIVVKADVTNSSEVEALVGETVKQFGRLDMYVHSFIFCWIYKSLHH
jgi:NAD(P)-dependent dehydrogenase (short-subunit alcohol dehydrogenase family)